MKYSNSIRHKLLLIILSIVFSAGFFFSFIGIPELINEGILKLNSTPGIDHAASDYDSLLYETYLDKFNLRLIGNLSLIIIGILVVLGFITGRKLLIKSGTVAIFLPVFGQYAVGMFFLTGIGILRVGWLPVINTNPEILKLGHIIYLPYRLVEYPFSLFSIEIGKFLPLVMIASGSFIFALGVLNWLQARFGKQDIAKSVLYKYSRHPQYLGWLILTYGLMLYSSGINNMKKSWEIPSSLPWLIMCMLIIGVCMIEELKMREKNGAEYDIYRKNTPFLFPLPLFLKRIISFPARIITKGRYPESRGQVILLLVFYTVILTSASLPFTNLTAKQSSVNPDIKANSLVLDSILLEIKRPQHRRYIHTHFEALEEYGSQAVTKLIGLLTDEDPVIREFTCISLGRLKSEEAINPLAEMLPDSVSRVNSEALKALSHIGSDAGLGTILEAASSDSILMHYPVFYDYLGSTGSEKTWSIISCSLKSDNWAIRSAVISNLYRLDKERSIQYVCESCLDESDHVRIKAVTILLDYNSPDRKSTRLNSSHYS